MIDDDMVMCDDEKIESISTVLKGMLCRHGPEPHDGEFCPACDGPEFLEALLEDWRSAEDRAAFFDRNCNETEKEVKQLRQDLGKATAKLQLVSLTVPLYLIGGGAVGIGAGAVGIVTGAVSATLLAAEDIKRYLTRTRR